MSQYGLTKKWRPIKQISLLLTFLIYFEPQKAASHLYSDLITILEWANTVELTSFQVKIDKTYNESN